MVTLEERELFLKAVRNPSFIAHKAEPASRSLPKKKAPPDYDFKLDLHALTAQQAEARVKACLIRCVELKKKRILIIHGKGSGILRYEIRSLLANSQLVSEIKDAPTRLGGDGAVIVLLRVATARHI